jgi:SAM-dependent methyltransferase
MLHDSTSNFSAASGEGYESLMGRWSRRLAGPFLDFAGLTDSGSILDAGCGTGALCAELLRRTETAAIVGVDIAEPYIDYARSAQLSPRIRFQTGDMTMLEFAQGRSTRPSPSSPCNSSPIPRVRLASSRASSGRGAGWRRPSGTRGAASR